MSNVEAAVFKPLPGPGSRGSPPFLAVRLIGLSYTGRVLPASPPPRTLFAGWVRWSRPVLPVPLPDFHLTRLTGSSFTTRLTASTAPS